MMIVEWTKECCADFDDEQIELIADKAKKKRMTDEEIKQEISSEIEGWDDVDYYSVTEEVYDKILQEIHKRIGGYQISMFD